MLVASWLRQCQPNRRRKSSLKLQVYTESALRGFFGNHGKSRHGSFSRPGFQSFGATA
jgi:hypothetical protein